MIGRSLKGTAERDFPPLHGGKTCRLDLHRQIDLRGGEARSRRRNRARDALRVDRRERYACRGSDVDDAIGRNIIGHKYSPELPGRRLWPNEGLL
jgi:hypothetical protein